MSVELTKEFMMNIEKLANIEQIEIKLMASIFMGHCENIKKEKVESFENSIRQQINFYGRKVDEYQTKMNDLMQQYEEQINKILKEYHTWYVAIIKDLQDTQANQKIAMANIKICYNAQNYDKMQAAQAKKNNYEIITQECLRQMTECEEKAKNKLNEISQNKDKQLMVGKVNFIQKIVNIFTGKRKAEIMFEALNQELVNLENEVNNQVPIINDETVHNIAIIKDAQIQAQEIFQNMLNG